MKFLNRKLLILTPWLLMACSAGSTTNGLSPADRQLITNMMHDYKEGWLANDSAKILGLFADTAILIPSGLNPIKGKKDMTAFWWPNDSSVTTIDKYDIDLLEINGSGDMAYVYENGHLSWSYRKDTFQMSKTQTSYEITLFRKADGKWRIVRRIWTDMKQAD